MHEVKEMYRKKVFEQIEMDIPFNVPLNEESKWVRLSKIMPWKEIEEKYAQHFKGNEGQVAKSSRLAFGSLCIQASEGFTDVQTKTHIQENPHMQFFCGFKEYRTEPPFDSSLMVHFRKRIPAEMLQEITAKLFADCVEETNDQTKAQEEMMACEEIEKSANEETTGEEITDEAVSKDEQKASTCNKGTLLLDATCCPQDIHYPTDMRLLNIARETSEEIVDLLHKTIANKENKKPRNYREVAHKEYMAYVKQRKHTQKTTRKAIGKQLGYLNRNIRSIEKMFEEGANFSQVPNALYKKWLVCAEVRRQQQVMYDTHTHSIEGRIVSIGQPWLRPIVRGKDGIPVEFGAKVAIGLVNGYAFITDMMWENFSEGKLLPQAIEQYKKTFGFYPANVIGDKAYPTRENRAYCKSRGIRLSSPKPGRKSEDEIKKERKQLYQDGCERNAVEGKFGVCKRKFGLSLIMTKLSETSLTSIAMGFFVANMERKLRILFDKNENCFLIYDFELACLKLLWEEQS